MQTRDTGEVLQLIRQGFRDLGYIGGLLQEDYEFADVLAPQYAVSRIPLAAFAQEPPSYRNASFGVVIANGRAGAELVQRYRSLGAPQILEVRNDHLLRWKMTSKGTPLLLQEVTSDQVPHLFAQHKDEWSPLQILRAKSAGTLATQIDFLDLGLLPLLEYEVRTKLDRLLSDTVAVAIETFRHGAPFPAEYWPPLFRLIFRLIASKVLADRRHPGNWLMDDPRLVVTAVENFYFKDTVPEPALDDYQTQIAIWQRIKSAFHFQNLSVDSLAYVYENTLVTPEMRRLFGIHSTPPSIAEYIVRRLPFDTLDTSERRVFEPFSGHSVFLVAAMQRLRELLPPEMSPQQRHKYFVEMLSGIEIDDFAREVARLSLMLADYPNPDGWRLHGGDVLASPLFEQELARARIVLCNPPFEEFSPAERERYGNLTFVPKPAEVLHRVLQNPPQLLGFVLPQAFLTGRSYRELRLLVGSTYSSVELLALPDRVFQRSDAETVLLLASRKNGRTVHLRVGQVYKRDLDEFYVTHRTSYEAAENVENAREAFERSMWLPPLREVWRATAQMKRLVQVASVHRGIEYSLPFREHQHELVSGEERPAYAPGVHRVEDTIEPFVVLKTVFLNVSPEIMRTQAYKLPWDRPKLIVNAVRRSRGPWRLTASLDKRGLVCYQNFHGIWPKGPLSLEVLAAVLNGPVANAFVATREGKRHVRAQTLKDIPLPDLDAAQQQSIASLVRQYIEVEEKRVSGMISARDARDAWTRLLMLIDAEVLKAYDLSPRVERELLDYFSGHARPGAIEFTGYFPSTFKPYIPWHLYISTDFREAKARDTLDRLPVIPEDPLITEALSYVA